jgi:integrase
MGTIYQRGRIWWLTWHVNGRRFSETSRSTRKDDARTLLKLREGDNAKGIPVTPRVGKYRYDEAVTDLLNHHKANRPTAERQHKKLKRRIEQHLTPFFGGRKMVALTAADVRAYVARRLDQKAANGTINRELTILKRMFSLAMKAEILFRKPAIELLREDNVRTGFFEPDQYHAVVKRLSPVLADVVTFAYVTGWRVASEVLPLEWRQFDIHAGTVRLDPGTTKNHEGRVISLNADLKLMLERRAKERDALKAKGVIVPWVFWRMVATKGRGSKKAPKRVKAFGKAWATACTNAGCPGRILHDLRRTAVRNMVRRGVPERVAMQITGHKTRSVFERYNIVSEGDLQAAARLLDGVTATISRETATASLGNS